MTLDVALDAQDILAEASATTGLNDFGPMDFLERLEERLHETGFLFPPEKAPGMVRNIRNLFQRIAQCHLQPVMLPELP